MKKILYIEDSIMDYVIFRRLINKTFPDCIVYWITTISCGEEFISHSGEKLDMVISDLTGVSLNPNIMAAIDSLNHDNVVLTSSYCMPVSTKYKFVLKTDWPAFIKGLANPPPPNA